MKWLLQRIKVLIRGVACAIIIAMPFTILTHHTSYIMEFGIPILQ